MKSLGVTLMATFAALGWAAAETIYSVPVGVVSIECPRNSDTIVGQPLRPMAVFSGSLGSDPDTTTIPGSAILSLSGGTSLTAGAYDAGYHYVKFKDSTPAAGRWYRISSNTTSSLTVNLNGGSITAVEGAALEVLKFWTLGELFPPAESTTLAETTGNAIVASLNTFANGLRTQVLFPDLVSAGINLASTSTYYVHGGVWKKIGAGATSHDDTILWPDMHFIIRHPAEVTQSTTYRIAGEVETQSFVLSLNTEGGSYQDNFVALPRAVDVTLNELNLGGTSAFMSSTSLFANGLRDQLIVFDLSQTAINKSAAATYFYYNGWKKIGGSGNDHGGDVIPAGAGFLIRKYASGDGSSQTWQNTPNY